MKQAYVKYGMGGAGGYTSGSNKKEVSAKRTAQKHYDSNASAMTQQANMTSYSNSNIN